MDDLEFYALLYKRLMLTGSILLSESPTIEQEAALAALKLELLTNSRPHNFRPNDGENEAVIMEKNFAELIAWIENNGTANARELPVFDFYARIDYLKKANQPSKK